MIQRIVSLSAQNIFDFWIVFQYSLILSTGFIDRNPTKDFVILLPSLRPVNQVFGYFFCDGDDTNMLFMSHQIRADNKSQKESINLFYSCAAEVCDYSAHFLTCRVSHKNHRELRFCQYALPQCGSLFSSCLLPFHTPYIFLPSLGP